MSFIIKRRRLLSTEVDELAGGSAADFYFY
jgi:hypothetical protein